MIRFAWPARCLFALGLCARAHAATLSVTVLDTHGHAVPNAVISIDRPAAGGTAATHQVDQKNEVFLPYVDVLRPGDQVVFHNSDDTRHHVYSFSPIAKFQFILKPGETSPAQALLQAGIVSVGCNIHDHMLAYLVVTPDQAKVSSEQGTVVFGDLPPGHYQLRLWHPQVLPMHLPPPQELDIPAQSTHANAQFKVELLPDPRMLDDREHLDY